jgi:hypothetical protein
VSLRNLLSTILLLGLLVGGGLPFAEPVRATSPFYDLRNESDRDAETADTTSPDTTPETTDSDTSSEEAESDTTPEDPASEPSDAEEPEPTPDADPSPRDTEPEQVEEEESAGDTTDEPSESPTPTEDTPTPESDEQATADGTILPLIDTDPLGDGTMPIRTARFPDTMDTAVRATRGTTVSTAVASAPASGTSGGGWYGFLGGHYLLIGSGTLGLLGLVLLAYLLRQPRVRVIKTANRTANKYLNLSRTKRSSGSEKQSLGEPVEPTGSGPVQNTGPRDGESAPAEQGTREEATANPEWDLPEDRLLDMGIDPSYRTAFKLYYEEGLSVEEVAERTDHGSGEVGLAVDLLERSADPTT